MHQVEDTDPAPDQVNQAPLRRSRAGGLLRHTFLIALVLVSGGLITSSAIELFFRYRESVAGLWELQREVARGAAFEMRSLCGISSTRCGPPRRPPTSWRPG